MGDVLNIRIIWKHSTCFFFIGNKTFIGKKKKKLIMFTMVNTLNNETNTRRSRAKRNRN